VRVGGLKGLKRKLPCGQRTVRVEKTKYPEKLKGENYLEYDQKVPVREKKVKKWQTPPSGEAQTKLTRGREVQKL